MGYYLYLTPSYWGGVRVATHPVKYEIIPDASLIQVTRDALCLVLLKIHAG